VSSLDLGLPEAGALLSLDLREWRNCQVCTASKVEIWRGDGGLADARRLAHQSLCKFSVTQSRPLARCLFWMASTRYYLCRPGVRQLNLFLAQCAPVGWFVNMRWSENLSKLEGRWETKKLFVRLHTMSHILWTWPCLRLTTVQCTKSGIKFNQIKSVLNSKFLTR